MKKWLIGIGTVMVLLVAAALIAPLLIPSGTYKDRLVALVRRDTGRDLTIAGPVRLSFLPSVAIEASDVALANAPGMHDADMLRLKKLELELRVPPLLHGSVEVGRFVLIEPRISLEVDKSGKPNWMFGATQPAPARPGAAVPVPATSASGPPSQIGLGDVRIVDGRIAYRDDRTGSEAVVDAINVNLSMANLETVLTANGSARYHDEKLSLSVGVDKPGALLSGAESGFRTRLEGSPLTVGFAGAMTGIPPRNLAGAIELVVPSVHGLAKWAGTPLPAGSGPEKLAIKGRIEAGGTKYAFSDASIAIDAITATGALAVDIGGAVPSLTGSLAVDKLDVNPYLPPPAPATGRQGTVGATENAGWSDAPIDLSGLKLADADFGLKAGAILWRKIVTGPGAVALHLKSGRFEADLSQLTLYDGQGHGKISVDGAAPTPAFATSFSLAGVKVEPLLEAAAGTGRLTGTGNLNFDVTGGGASERALVAALNGKGAFDLSNGQLKGVNLVAVAENAVKSLTGGTGGDNATTIGSLTGTFTITNGILKNNDLRLKSGDVPMTGAGTVDLPNRHVDYRVVPSLAGAISVPIIVSGPWEDLSYRPDVAGTLKGAAQGAVKAPGEILNMVPGVLGLPGGGGSGQPSGGGLPNPLKNLFGK